MKNAGEKYKMELIEELDDSEKISFYKQGECEEFCAGPHISNVCQIKAIFTIFDEGPGLPVFLPKGMVLKNLLIDYWRKIHRREGYVEISTPIMLERMSRIMVPCP